MMRIMIVMAMSLTACGGHAATLGTDTSSLLHDDLVAYATASCLTFQDNAYLQDQGQRWAGAIMQNAHGPVAKWAPVAAAVKAELARSGIAQGQGEGPQAPSVALPVMTCGRIATAPVVRRAVATATKALAMDYLAGPR